MSHTSVPLLVRVPDLVCAPFPMPPLQANLRPRESFLCPWFFVLCFCFFTVKTDAVICSSDTCRGAWRQEVGAGSLARCSGLGIFLEARVQIKSLLSYWELPQSKLQHRQQIAARTLLANFQFGISLALGPLKLLLAIRKFLKLLGLQH